MPTGEYVELLLYEVDLGSMEDVDPKRRAVGYYDGLRSRSSLVAEGIQRQPKDVNLT